MIGAFLCLLFGCISFSKSVTDIDSAIDIDIGIACPVVPLLLFSYE